MSLGSNIKSLREKCNLTQQQLADKVGKSKALIALWESDKRDPQSQELLKMSNIFGVKIDNIVTSLPNFSNAETYKINEHQVLRPILGIVKAGYDMYCEENILGYKATDSNKTKGADTFWLKVVGDSMNAVGILEGSLVLVKKTLVENNKIGIVRVNGDEATIKQIVYKDDTVILRPCSTNPIHQIMILKKEDFDNKYAEIIGKVIDVSFDPNDML